MLTFIVALLIGFLEYRGRDTGIWVITLAAAIVMDLFLTPVMFCMIFRPELM